LVSYSSTIQLLQTSSPFIRNFNKEINKNKQVKEIKVDKSQELIGIGKVIPLQARCGPEDGYRYSSTLP
jgi:hypothetical protein